MASIKPIDIVRILSPLSRTLVHDDNEKALNHIKSWLPDLNILHYPSGQNVWTWKIPNKWTLKESWIKDANTGELLWDGLSHPLATVNYSMPIDLISDVGNIEQHLHVSNVRPEAIPFVFRFYNRDWGFCMPVDIKDKVMKCEKVHVCIKTEEVPGDMAIGEYFLKGKNENEILIVSDVCHPSIANDSITGVAAAINLANYLKNKESLKYSYRFIFLPETIGSIAYLANNEYVLKNIVAGFFSEMLGNKNSLCLQLSRNANSYLDIVAQNLLKEFCDEGRVADFLKSAANDEKVLDSPGVNIPTISLSRYPYPEYHTSDDNDAFIDEEVLNDSCEFINQLFERVESDYVPIYETKGPICLAEHGLYPDWYKDPSLKQKWEGYLEVQYGLNDYTSSEELAFKLNLSVETVNYWVEGFQNKGFMSKKEHVADR